MRPHSTRADWHTHNLRWHSSTNARARKRYPGFSLVNGRTHNTINRRTAQKGQPRGKIRTRNPENSP